MFGPTRFLLLPKLFAIAGIITALGFLISAIVQAIKSLKRKRHRKKNKPDGANLISESDKADLKNNQSDDWQGPLILVMAVVTMLYIILAFFIAFSLFMGGDEFFKETPGQNFAIGSMFGIFSLVSLGAFSAEIHRLRHSPTEDTGKNAGIFIGLCIGFALLAIFHTYFIRMMKQYPPPRDSDFLASLFGRARRRRT